MDGSEEEYNRLAQELVDAGTFVRLSDHEFPELPTPLSPTRTTWHVSRAHLHLLRDRREGAGPTNNWRDPVEMKQTLTGLFEGSMRGRTMYVIPSSWAP